MRMNPALLLVVWVFSAWTSIAAPRQLEEAEGEGPPFVVEYYYKVKWGHFDEFVALYKKNHYPVLLKEKELGRILSVSAVSPEYHMTEEGRWDFRVTIVWKDAATTQAPFDNTAIIELLYPDTEKFKREERRRFEILEAHWDLPLSPVALDR